MLVWFACCVALAAALLMPHGARAQNCAEEISKLMSKDTEKLTTRYQRITKQIQEKGANAKLLSLDGPCGHIAPTCEAAKLAQAVLPFLAQ